VYLIGVGKMGRLVARSLAPAFDLVLVGRDPARLEPEAQALGARTAPLTGPFPGAAAVLLALPTEVTVPILEQVAAHLPPEAVVINIATAVLKKDLTRHIPAERLAAAKLVAHYYDMQAGGKALVVIDAGSPTAEGVARALMGHVGPVMAGKEDWVLASNRIATEEAVRTALRIRHRLAAAGVPEEIVRQVVTGVQVGAIRAFMDGKLGPFGQAIAERVLAELTNQNG
jgi:pyrroline-5-carboxylate reductase